jgi:hypothetical protein
MSAASGSDGSTSRGSGRKWPGEGETDHVVRVMLTRLQDGEAGRNFNKRSEYKVPSPPWLEDPRPCDVPMELDPRPTEETRDRECLKIKIDLRRLLPTREVPMELDPLPTEETSEGRESLKIRIDRRRLKVLCKEQKAPY